jgi:hypothetical protein
MTRRIITVHRILLGMLTAAATFSVTAHASTPTRHTTQATLRGKTVSIEYGHVELKGRPLDALLAQLPEDRVWRAGADEVTTLTTESDLTIDGVSGASCSRVRATCGGRKVPAGRYSVYVSASQEGNWSLILNSDPGIELGALAKRMGFSVDDADAKRMFPHLEGYNMNRANDVAGIAGTEVARAAMKPGTTAPPVDRFTMRLEPAGPDALTLTLLWGDRTWSLDLRTAPESAAP